VLKAALPFQVFLSYGRPDIRAVQRFYRMLVGAGIAAWMDVENIRCGEEWELAIKRALRDSQLVLVFLSRNSVTRAGYLQNEILEAVEVSKRKPPGGIFLIPLLLDDCPIHPHLERFHCVSLVERGGWERVFTEIRGCQREYLARHSIVRRDGLIRIRTNGIG
jgi:TIR domain